LKKELKSEIIIELGDLRRMAILSIIGLGR